MLNERKIFIKLTRRYAFLLFIFLNIPYLLALGLAFYSYKGMCSGFMSDYSGECNFGTYVNNEFFIASMLNIIPVPICVAFWGMAVGNYCKFMIGKSSIANFLPFSGVIIGLVLGLIIWLVYPLFLGSIITR
jgi:ABC-type spermidine/putrescine transport system permease subunit II